MKWNLIIMLLYSFMWKLQNSPNQNTKKQSIRNEMKPDYYAFILIHLKASKKSKSKYQKVKVQEMKWNLIIMLLYSFMWKLQNSPNQEWNEMKQSIRNEMKPDYYAFILIHVKVSK